MWRSSRVAFLSVPLPLLSWFRVSPSFRPFFSRFGGLFILLPLGFWPQCDGCYSGGLDVGRGLVAGLRVGRPVGVLPATWPMGTQTPLATQALTMIIYTDDGL